MSIAMECNPKSRNISYTGAILAGSKKHCMRAGTGVGHIWLYSTKDWSCRRMEGGLLQPPLACCFCDWGPLSHQVAHLFVAPGPTAAAQCLPVPTITKVIPCLHAPFTATNPHLCTTLLNATVAHCSIEPTLAVLSVRSPTLTASAVLREILLLLLCWWHSCALLAL